MSASTVKNVPAHIAARIAARGGAKSAITAALASEGFSYPKISTRSSRFRLVDDGVETVVGTSLDVIIVGANPKVSKIWYSKAYDGATDVRPDCWSNDGITPDSTVEKPFHANCQTCPNNVLGSKVTPSGQKTTVCASQRHLAVVPAADPSKIYGLTVPVSGMKSLREHIKDLSNYGLEPQEVITELTFDEQASYPKIVFGQKEQNGFVPEKALSAIEEICNAPEIRVVTRQDGGVKQIAAPAKAPVLTAPVQLELPVTTAQPQAEAPKAVKPKAEPKAEVKAAPKAEENTAVEGGDEKLSAMEAKLKALFSGE